MEERVQRTVVVGAWKHLYPNTRFPGQRWGELDRSLFAALDDAHILEPKRVMDMVRSVDRPAIDGESDADMDEAQWVPECSRPVICGERKTWRGGVEVEMEDRMAPPRYRSCRRWRC